MSEVATAWRRNGVKAADAVSFSSAAVAYSDPNTAYSSSTVGLDEFNELASTWRPTAKTAERWQANTAADDNLYPFDSGTHTYDSSTDTYDGVVAANEQNNTNTPTTWRAA